MKWFADEKKPVRVPYGAPHLPSTEGFYAGMVFALELLDPGKCRSHKDDVSRMDEAFMSLCDALKQ
jgi:hypothetical protein